MSSQDDITRIVWNIEVPPNTSVSIEEAQTHDGKLDEYDDYSVALDENRQVVVTDGHDAHIYLDAKQALLLLAWLEENRTRLEELAKEQAE